VAASRAAALAAAATFWSGHSSSSSAAASSACSAKLSQHISNMAHTELGTQYWQKLHAMLLGLPFGLKACLTLLLPGVYAFVFGAPASITQSHY
jgi:hypothetical protein